ncbi:aminotransferase [Halocaridina rubra]|uniref:Ubiquitin thioesterase OTU n=1 Tax=Halocaridina rubra TaxID=373956 RepID=A0AAN8WTT6_HALRR
MMYRLRVKTKGGGQYSLSDRVSGESTFGDLLSAIEELTSISPGRQKVLTGFPPKPIQGSLSTTLQAVGVRNGDVLIIEEVESPVNTSCPSTAASLERGTLPVDRVTLPNESSPCENSHPLPAYGNGILMKKVVPSDNSCLFASVFYLVNGGSEIDLKAVQELRKIVANAVKQHPDLYNEALLERTNEDYSRWILKETSWGGAIELSILSQYYEMEIVAVDAKTGVLNRFGEDKKFSYRMIVIYDGIHYDPLFMETPEGTNLTIFPSSDEYVLSQAKEIAMEAKQSGQYTDTNVFSLECKECGVIMRGEKQALEHAKNTDHSKFDEGL